ncbi:NPCBM/NEW2 domain-containing protein [Microbispora sp. NPDC004025]
MAHPSEAPAKPNARLLPQAVGVVADVAAVAALLAGGGVAVVWTASFGALVAGAYILWRRWGEQVDRTLLAGFAVAVAGAGMFGYAAATRPSQDAGSPAPVQRVDEGAAANSSGETTAPAQEQTGAATSPGTTWLVDMPTVDGGEGWERGSRTVGAKVFPHSVVGSTCFSADDSDVSFDLGRRFRRFQATVGLADDAHSGSRTRFTVFLEGRQLFSRDLRLAEQARVDVPVAGGLRLVLHVEPVGLTECGATAVWGEALLR